MELPIKGQLKVSVTDNVLEDGDWGTDCLMVRDGKVVKQITLTKGCYTIPNMVGWTREQLVEWSQYDATGRHPENYHEVDICT